MQILLYYYQKKTTHLMKIIIKLILSHLCSGHATYKHSVLSFLPDIGVHLNCHSFRGTEDSDG